MTWTASCSETAQNYGIYRGTLGTWYSHTRVDCFDNLGDLTEDTEMPGGDAYFLVVANTLQEEGSYGKASSGVERPVGNLTCAGIQSLEACP